jgi:hypothetical protein
MWAEWTVCPQPWIAAASPARSAGRSRALTSTTVVRLDARSAIATDGATSKAELRRRDSEVGSGGGEGLASAASTDLISLLRSRRSA